MIISIEFVSNKELDFLSLNKIINLKMQHWNYQMEDQIQWIKKNIRDNDFHLMLFDNKKELIAYLNIINLKIEIENKEMKYLGIGNVCVNSNYKGNGYGVLIVNIANFFINHLGLPGILLCKKSLNNFYQKAGWILYKGETYVDNIPYHNSVFVINNLITPIIKIDKNF